MNQSEYFTPQSHDHSTPIGPNPSKVKERGFNTKKRVAGDVQEKLESGRSPKSKSTVINSHQKALTNGYQSQSICLDNHSESSDHINQTEQVDKGEQILKINVNNSYGPLPHETLADPSLVPTVLYQHRVRGLVLALLVEPDFNTDPTAREEVVRSLFFCTFEIIL